MFYVHGPRVLFLSFMSTSYRRSLTTVFKNPNVYKTNKIEENLGFTLINGPYRNPFLILNFFGPKVTTRIGTEPDLGVPLGK